MAAVVEPVPQVDDTDTQDISRVFLRYYEEGFYTDVTFSIGCGDERITVSAHKLVLSMFSEVFADMFELHRGKQDPFEINDVSPMAFEVMIRFMYGSYCELENHKFDINFLLKIFKVAEQFMVEALVFICKRYFARMTPDKHNVFQLLHAAKLIGNERVELRCIHLLETKTGDVLVAQDLPDVTLAMITTILNLKNVSFSSEYELVMWMFSWAKNQVLKTTNDGLTIRNILEDVLELVDLTAMKAEEFGKLLDNHPNVFTESEGFSIFRNIVRSGSYDLPVWASRIHRTYNYKG